MMLKTHKWPNIYCTKFKIFREIEEGEKYEDEHGEGEEDEEWETMKNTIVI